MDVNSFLEEQLNNPEIKKEYDALKVKYAVRQGLIDVRIGLKIAV